MNFIKSVLLVSIATLSLCAISVKSTYPLSNDYTLTIHGTSNLHDWDEKVGKVKGDADINWNNDGSFNLNAVNIKANVNSIKSTSGSVMNKNTYKALKSGKNPEIIFKLSTPLKSIKLISNKTSITVKGNLSIAGITKPIDLYLKISMSGQGKLAFEGSETLKMTDYGIDPPTALFGSLKTGNTITVNFKTNVITTIN